MSKWLKTVKGEFEKDAIKAVKLRLKANPIYKQSKINPKDFVFDYYETTWQVKLLVNGHWKKATDTFKNKQEAQEEYERIMQELEGENEQ